MADRRVIETVLAGKETISTAAKKAERGVEQLGDELRDTARDAETLDDRIDEVNASLKDLASQYARTNDDAFVKQIRAQERELRKLTKARSLLGNVAEEAAEVGVEAGSKFSIGMAATMAKALPKVFARGGPAFGPALAVLAPTAAFVGSAAGAVMAGAMVSAITGGAIAGGVALAFSDPQIQAEARELGDTVLGGLTEAASAFHEPVRHALSLLSGDFHAILPDIRGTFATAASYLDPLVKGFGGLVRQVAPALRRSVESAKPLIDVISRGMVTTGRSIGSVLDSLNDNGREMAAGLAIAFGLVQAAIRGVGTTLNIATEIFGGFLTVFFKLSEWAGRVGEKLAPLPGSLGSIGRSLVELNGPVQQAKADWDQWTADAREGLSGVITGTTELNAQQRVLNGSMREAINAAGSLSAAFDLLNGKALSAREAESQYQAAIDAVTESIKLHGKTLDLDTEAGRANDQAIRNLITATDRKAQATYDDILATEGAVAAEQAALKVYKDGRAQLVDNLTAILGNAAAARKLADEIMKIPKSWSASITVRTRVVGPAIVQPNGDIRIVGVGTQIRGAAHGGPIEGPGPKGVDSVPIMAAPGEHVWTAAEVDAAGGHAKVAAIRKAVLSGASSAVAPAASTTPPPVRASASGGTRRLEVEVVGEREIVAFFRRLIKQYRLLEA